MSSMLDIPGVNSGAGPGMGLQRKDQDATCGEFEPGRLRTAYCRA